MLIAHFFTLSFRKKILTFFTQIKRYTFNFSESKYWNQDLINYKNEVHNKSRGKRIKISPYNSILSYK